jgi:hypothetical protein
MLDIVGFLYLSVRQSASFINKTAQRIQINGVAP